MTMKRVKLVIRKNPVFPNIKTFYFAKEYCPTLLNNYSRMKIRNFLKIVSYGHVGFHPEIPRRIVTDDGATKYYGINLDLKARWGWQQ